MHAQTADFGLLDHSLPPIAIDDSLGFLQPATIEALAYWKSRLDGRLMPSRADLDPRQMRAFMAHIALIELRSMPDGKQDYYIRLAGTAVEQLFGPFTGQSISEFLPAEIEARWRSMLDAARDAASPIRTIGRVAFQRKTWLECETMIAPLGTDGKTVSMFFVAVATWDAR
jgi:hypothetical protein